MNRFLQPDKDFADVTYLLRDDFTSTESAPLGTPRTAEPGPGSWTVVETDGQLSIASGAVTFPAQSSPAWGGQGIVSGAISRAAGVVLVAAVNVTTWEEFGVGWHTSAAIVDPDSAQHALQLNTTNGQIDDDAGTALHTGLSAGAGYKAAIVLRAAGAHYMVHDGTDWLLESITAAGSTATLYAMLANLDGVVVCDYAHVPDALWTPTPLASDSFNRANSSTLGSTDGAGAEESGGSGLAWTDIVGDCEIISNAFATNGPGNDAATVDAGESDVVIQLDCNDRNLSAVFRGNGTSDDYWFGNLDSAGGMQIREVLSGTATTRASSSPGIASGAVTLLVIADDEDITFLVNGGNRLTYGLAAAYKTATCHGIRLGSSVPGVNNFSVWPRKPSTPSWM